MQCKTVGMLSASLCKRTLTMSLRSCIDQREYLLYQIWVLDVYQISIFQALHPISLPLTRRTLWRSRDGRTSTVTYSGRLSILWSSALCWARGSSSSAWSSSSSVSVSLSLVTLQIMTRTSFIVHEVKETSLGGCNSNNSKSVKSLLSCSLQFQESKSPR